MKKLIACLALLLTVFSFYPAYGQQEELEVNDLVVADTTTVKVLVLNFDPIMSKSGTRLHQKFLHNNPHILAREYAKRVNQVSKGFIKFDIVEWQDLDVFPAKIDGFQYTRRSYTRAAKGIEAWHQPDGLDYIKVINDYNVVAKIDSGAVDEVWLFGAPYFGYWESCMAGPGAFFINGPTYTQVKSSRPFAIMGFNYERGVAEMLHNLCHRAESTMRHFYGGWRKNPLLTNWDKFAANASKSNGEAGVGDCHFPPNATSDYDYANFSPVESTADDWLNYPNLTGKKTKVSATSWGGPDYQLNYIMWWFTRFPRAEGTNPDGRVNNWWRYLFNFNDYKSDGSPK